MSSIWEIGLATTSRSGKPVSLWVCGKSTVSVTQGNGCGEERAIHLYSVCAFTAGRVLEPDARAIL